MEIEIWENTIFLKSLLSYIFEILNMLIGNDKNTNIPTGLQNVGTH